MVKLEVIDNTKESKEHFHEGGYGGDDKVITKEQLESLISGKTLAWNDGEYTHTITLEGELNES